MDSTTTVIVYVFLVSSMMSVGLQVGSCQLREVVREWGFLIRALVANFVVLPLMIRSSEQALRAVSRDQRQAALALAVSRAGWIRRILVPSAAPGIAAGIILSVGRALAETAVLLFTAGYVLRRPDSVLDSGRALSVHVYDMAMNVPGGGERAAATALVLVTLLVVINLMVRTLVRSSRTGVVQ